MNQLVTFGGEVLTMSSREIAELTRKNHADVMRDIRNMISQLGLVESTFAGYYKAGNGKKNPLYNLPKDLTLTLVTGYDVVRRHAINKRWLELEAKESGAVNSLPQEIRSQVGGIIKKVVHKEITDAIQAALPALLHGEIAKRQMAVRRGVTAGQVWAAHRLPTKGMRGAASWFGNRLAECGCCIADGGMSEMGGRTARLFDPDKASAAMRGGLKSKCDAYISRRFGQASLPGFGA